MPMEQMPEGRLGINCMQDLIEFADEIDRRYYYNPRKGLYYPMSDSDNWRDIFACMAFVRTRLTELNSEQGS